MSRSISSILNQIDMQSYRQNHPEYVAELAATRLRIEQTERGYDTATLPAFAQVALLWMHESQVRRALCARLLEGWTAQPGLRDFRLLVQRGLCQWRPGKRQHELTPAGVIAVRKLERNLCVRFGIHEFIETPVKVDWQDRYHCTCGASYLVRRSPTAPGNARRQWAAEHATQDGMQRLTTALALPTNRAEA